MSKNLVLQVNIQLEQEETRFPVIQNLLNDSIISAKQYADKVNADYLQHTGPRLYSKYSVCMEKFCVYSNEYKTYDKIFLLDTDVIVHPYCPDIFQFDEFSARPENESRHKEKILKNLLIDNSEHNYFNSGVMLFTRDFLNNTVDHLDKFDSYKEKFDDRNLDFFDQRIFNRILSELSTPYNHLEYAWNCEPTYNGNHYITHYMYPWKDLYEGNNNV